MAEGEEKLTGLSKYFNSVTPQGRANVSIVTSKLSRATRARLSQLTLPRTSVRSIDFSGIEGHVRHPRTDRSLFLPEAEEQKDVVRSRSRSRVM